MAERLPAQPSFAVAPGSEKEVWHSTVIGLEPFKVIIGAVVSTTSIITVSSEEPPALDVTVRVMLCEPTGSDTTSVAPVPKTVAPSFHV